MCGRFSAIDTNDAMAAQFKALIGNDLPVGPNYNVCPTNTVAVVTSDGSRRLRAMRWGFVPAWYKTPGDGPLIINARSDTIAVKPAFRDAVRQRRCIVPVAGFYEWQTGADGTKLPWYFTRTDGGMMALAGIWQAWGDMDTVAIVSTEAGPGMQGLHHREAVMLERDDWPLWLGEAGHGAAVLMKPSAADLMGAVRVGTAVNSNRASGAALIVPIAA